MSTEREWRYLIGGKVRHALPPNSFNYNGLSVVATCGIGPEWADCTEWRGTGSQLEYEKAANLPKCKRCLKLLGE